MQRKKEKQGGWLSAKDREQLDALIQKQKDLGQAVRDAAQAHDEATKRILFDLIEQRLAVDGLSKKEFDFLTGLAQKWGLIDDTTAEAVQGIDKSLDVLANSDNAQAALDMIDDIRRSVEGIPKKVNVDINVQTHGSIPLFAQRNQENAKGRPPKMAGGPLAPGAAYIAGEHGAEAVVPSRPAVVRQAVFHNNYHITAQQVDGRSIMRQMWLLEQAAFYGY